MDTYLPKLRVLFGGLVILAGLVLLVSIIAAYRQGTTVFAVGSDSSQSFSADNQQGSPNAVSAGLSRLANSTVSVINSVENSLSTSFNKAVQTTTQTGAKAGRVVGHAGKVAGKTVYRGVSVAASFATGTFVFIVQAPFKAFDYMAGALSSSPVARPEDTTDIPIIDSQLADFYATHPETTSAPAILPSLQESEAMWPIHGRITTKFGVPHRPYQVTHTGLDISSGSYSGITAVTPFRGGQVLDVIRSKVGLGNYVVIDHGDGLTSVYAHLYSIAVTPGQTVDTGTVLGKEGSTGASTGTHLHFEIRLNGQPVDPHQYLTGQP